MNPVDEYIASQDPSVQEALHTVRNVIRSVLPEAEEKISWGMPTWRMKHNIIHFAAAKKHIGIYPGPEAVEHFKALLDEKGLSYDKGTIRIPYTAEIPSDLIRQIAVWNLESGNHA